VDGRASDIRSVDLHAWALWLVGGSFMLTMLLRDYMASDAGLIDHSAFWGRDFINVWTGGHLVREGRIDLIYNLSAYAEYQRSLFHGIELHNYSYPPVSFPLAACLSLLPYPLALAIWLSGTAAFFVWAARPWWPKEAGPAWLAIITPAALVNIWAGHYGFLLGGLFLLGWQNLESRPRIAGLFFGLMLIKPHLALMVPLILAIRKQWTAVAWAAGTAATLVVATTLAYGWAPWHDFLFRTTGVQAQMIDPRAGLFGTMSTSMASGVLRIGGTMSMAVAMHAALAIPALIMTARAAASGAGTRDIAFIAATATFIVLPYSFNYDLTVVMIGALWVLTRPDLSESDQRLAFYGFLSPQVGMVLSGFMIPAMPIMLMGLLYAQYRLAVGLTEVQQARAA
jgi:alpha-1,2-mannosyltransferase